MNYHRLGLFAQAAYYGTDAVRLANTFARPHVAKRKYRCAARELLLFAMRGGDEAVAWAYAKYVAPQLHWRASDTRLLLSQECAAHV